jgi:hypothetical protein
MLSLLFLLCVDLPLNLLNKRPDEHAAARNELCGKRERERGREEKSVRGDFSLETN